MSVWLIKFESLKTTTRFHKDKGLCSYGMSWEREEESERGKREQVLHDGKDWWYNYIQ